MKSHSDSYKAAGVDVTAGYEGVKLMKKSVESTFTPEVLSGIGGFGGCFAPNLEGIKEPVLISGTDGVGTKLKIAFLMGKHDTVGIDCVAMCVNDILCAGARPMFFLDYIALGKNIPEKVAEIVSGVAEGCRQSACSLIGGETAEMPGFYQGDDYDMAGFTVGVVDKEKMLSGDKVKEGDVIIALPSSGVHSNGFSLVRHIFKIDNREVLDGFTEELGKTLGETLLTPTRIYVKPVLEALKQVDIHCMAHITGGGLYENIPRALNDHVDAVVDKELLRVLPI
ncbi:MAG: phosphoribosylformylglycinamidine cyclo-ligase, partial [Oscillospiraceae bacterium]